jgi:predicted restriction endonuclease
MTGITEKALLRASHIVAWADCETDELRLDVHNGLLLSALWDAAFDCGLISFGDGGEVLSSPELSASALAALNGQGQLLDGLADAHRANLARHRLKHGF